MTHDASSNFALLLRQVVLETLTGAGAWKVQVHPQPSWHDMPKFPFLSKSVMGFDHKTAAFILDLSFHLGV